MAGEGKRGREFLASQHSSFATAPAGVHELAWALAKLWAPAEAKPEHVPQGSGLFKGWPRGRKGSLRGNQKGSREYIGKGGHGTDSRETENQGSEPGRVRIQN